MVRGMEVLDEKKSILIIDDDENICRTLSLILNKKGYHVETVNKGSKALEKIRERFFNITLIDIKLPDIEGIELISPLKKIQPGMELIMITGQGSMETAIGALNEGASSYITKPLNMEELLAKIKEIFEKQDSILRNFIKPEIIEKQKILIIDDDKNICRTLSLILNKKGFEVETVETGYEALEKALARFFNVVILDLILPDINGLELIKPLKNIHPDTGVMIVTDYGSMESAIHALNLGAFSYITKPLDLDEVLGKISDKLEKQKAEQAIANLAKFPSENPNPVLRVNKEKVLYINQAGKILFKIERGSKIPEALRNIVYKSFIDNSNKILETTLENRVFSFNISQIENKNYANIYGMDITEKKKAEEKINEQNEFLTNVIDSLTHPFYVINIKDYTIELMNPVSNIDISSSSLTCYELTHKLGEPCSGEISCPLEEVIKTKKPCIVEHRHYDNNGNLKDFEVYGYPIFNKVGDIIQMIEYTLDITERKKAEEELKATLKDLKRSNTELEQFAYVTSHDLQEPLRMVTSFTQLLQKRYKDKLDKDANDYINFAVDGAARMIRLINDLLIFSRVGTRGKAFTSVDMNVIYNAILNNLIPTINETNAKIACDPLPIIKADMSQMLQLLQNLISNAIKFHSDKPPKIHLSCKVKNNEWMFSVKDNGIGIDKKYTDRIFIIFQRLHKKNEFGGTGIGLAVCKKIIQRHGGKIWVESEIGKGSTFYFTISKIKVGKKL